MTRRASKSMEYWEKSVPWLYEREHLGYEERRRLRYELQDYMLDEINFSAYKTKRVLEIGSGSGIDSAEFGRNRADIVSLDFTQTGARATCKTLKEAGVTPNVIRAAADRLPFRQEVFDCVYSFGVLHHIIEVGAVVREINKILRRNGKIMCMLYNRSSLLYAYSILFLHKKESLREEELLRMYSERNLNCPYTRVYTKEEACKLFSDYFDVQAVVRYNVIDLPRKRKFKLNIPNEYELGWHILVRGKKSLRSGSRA